MRISRVLLTGCIFTILSSGVAFSGPSGSAIDVSGPPTAKQRAEDEKRRQEREARGAEIKAERDRKDRERKEKSDAYWKKHGIKIERR